MRNRGILFAIAWPLLAILFAAAPAAAQTVTFTEAQINSLSSVLDSVPDIARDLTGADVLVGPIAGTRNAAFGSNPNFVIKPVTDSVFAKASLQQAVLKTKAALQLGSNGSVLGAGITLGSRNGSASGNATLADSFRTYSGTLPFLWTNGTTVAFNFAVTGQFTLNGTIPTPASLAPGEPLDQIYALLFVNIYKPGTIDLLRQQKEFNFSAYPDSATASAAFTALANQIQANLITRDYWYFGNLVAWFGSSVPAAKLIPVNTTTPTPVQFQFTPGGDFDWTITLDTTAQLDAYLQNVSATLDFSNSIDTSYDAPAGATTYSGSGLFPGTQPFSAIPPANKCPVEQGVWKNSTAAWPVFSLTLGNQTYSQAELLNILQNPGNGDASTILAVQLIAAKLNIANGSNPAPIASTIASADAALSAYAGAGKLPYKVKTSTAAGAAMTTAGSTLQSYNRQLLTPGCTP